MDTDIAYSIVYIVGVVVAFPIITKLWIWTTKKQYGDLWKENWENGDTLSAICLPFLSWVLLLVLLVAYLVYKIGSYFRNKKIERDFNKKGKLQEHKLLTFLDNITRSK